MEGAAFSGRAAMGGVVSRPPPLPTAGGPPPLPLASPPKKGHQLSCASAEP